MGSGVVACRLQSADSEVVAHRLSCPTAYEIFPDQRSNLCSPAVASEFLSTVPPGKSSLFLLSRAWVSLMEKSLAFHVHIKYNFCYGSISHKGGVENGSVWKHGGTFLEVQWLRLYLPMQGTWV